MSIQSKIFSMHALTSLLYIYVTTHKRKAPIYKLSRSKAPKTQQVANHKPNRKTVDFLWYHTGVYSSSRNNLANLGSSPKVSAPVNSINFWKKTTFKYYHKLETKIEQISNLQISHPFIWPPIFPVRFQKHLERILVI